MRLLLLFLVYLAVFTASAVLNSGRNEPHGFHLTMYDVCTTVDPGMVYTVTLYSANRVTLHKATIIYRNPGLGRVQFSRSDLHQSIIGLR